jgi:hypothetical protein
MQDIGFVTATLGLLGAALAVAIGIIVWRLDAARRVSRSLAQVLGAPPQPMLTSRGRGIGFDLTANAVAITWDKGAWCLAYAIDELMGVELILDRQIAARAFRGENRRPLEHFTAPEEWVRLRFIFDDPGHPDFVMDIWRPGDEARGGFSSDDAVTEANRWLARMESLLRRPAPLRFGNISPGPTPAGFGGLLFANPDDADQPRRAVT